MTSFKKLLLALPVLLIASLSAQAQTSAEIHYDFGRHIYNGLESEKPIQIKLKHLSFDKWGRNFGYIRLNPSTTRIHDMEVLLQRDLKIVESPFSVRMEYYAMMHYMSERNHSLTSGIAYNYSSESFAFSIAPSYRYDFGVPKHHNAQLSGDWAWTSWNRCWSFTGCFVLWSNRSAEESRERVRFFTEPQIWCHLNQFVGVPDELNLSIGSEMRMEYNILRPGSFFVRPSLAAKWTF